MWGCILVRGALSTPWIREFLYKWYLLIQHLFMGPDAIDIIALRPGGQP